MRGETMRAAVWRGVGRPLSIEALMLKQPGPSEVEVEVAACAVCHSDLTFIDGGWSTTPPAVFGHEASGRVRAVGSGVTGVTPGDRVCVTLARSCSTCRDCAKGRRPATCTAALPPDRNRVLMANGAEAVWQGLATAAFAERTVVHESQVIAAPASAGWATAAVVSCAVLTGYGSATRAAAVAPGEDVAVIGLGGVGLNAVQAARLAGARAVIAVDVAPDRLAVAARFGATTTVDPARSDLRACVLALTEGFGAHKVIVCASAAAVIDAALDLLAIGGTLVIAGMPPDGAQCSFDPSALADRSQTIRGSKLGDVVIREDVPHIFSLHARGLYPLDDLVTRTFRFEDINEALDAMRRGEGVRNVVLFDWARMEEADGIA